MGEETARPIALEDVLAPLQVLIADREPFWLKMGAFDAWCVFAQLQLALRHPGNTGAPATAARRAAERLQEDLVARHPALAALADAGWDRTQDRA